MQSRSGVAANDDEDLQGEVEKVEITYINNTGTDERVGCGDFELLRLVGRGSFAKVFQVNLVVTDDLHR